jgi:hypothetical protein
MAGSQDELEDLWDSLLSRQVELVLKAFNSLDDESKKAVILHLQRMSTEIGWHPEQAASAKMALDTLLNHDLPGRFTSL